MSRTAFLEFDTRGLIELASKTAPSTRTAKPPMDNLEAFEGIDSTAGIHGLFEAIGGARGCMNLARDFYFRVASDPVLKPLFPSRSLRCAIDQFSAFLVQFLGGPSSETEHRNWFSLQESHRRFKIGVAEREAWLDNMSQAISEVDFPDSIRTSLLDFFTAASIDLVNCDPKPRAESIKDRELGERWQFQKALEQATAAVRSGDPLQAIGIVERSDVQQFLRSNRSIHVGLLGVMLEASDRMLLSYIERTVRGDTRLLDERYGGKAIIHYASMNGVLSVVELLLGLGVDPNLPDSGGHPPLYRLADSSPPIEGDAIVYVLVQAGAEVNTLSGVKRCSALHMAARRDNLLVAEALLKCGADTETRDSQGNTPLRRAVNCGSTGVAALLVAHGANIHSVGSKNVTPLQAAKSGKMKAILGGG